MSGEPARGYSWPPFENGNEASVKHGAFSEEKVGPVAERIAAELRDRVPLQSASDDAAVWLLAGQLARIQIVRDWLSRQPHGVFRSEAGEPQGVLKMLSVWENSASRLLAQLGLTLEGRAAIGVDLAQTAVLTKRASDLSALSIEELAQLRALTLKVQVGGDDAGD
jgi:hypothetical protein